LKLRLLFILSAVFESSTGLALLVAPALVVSILIGTPFDTPADSIVGRVAGAALLSLGVSCWRARQDEQSRAANGIALAMLLYNVAVALALVYAGIGLRLFGIGLWPVVALHVVMAVWCFSCVMIRRS
jgi:hypothetical protein